VTISALVQPLGGSRSHPYPLVCAGGLFLVLVGIAIVSGALYSRWRVGFLGGGLIVASVATAVATPRLVSGLGAPSRSQIVALSAAVIVEAILIPLAVRATRHRGERTRWLVVFFMVGLHFLPMAVAFGPVVLVLGLAIMLNTTVGLWRLTGMNLQFLWLTDGLLKVTAGVMMLLGVS